MLADIPLVSKKKPTKEERETKTKLLQEISEELEFDIEYILLLVTSTIIVTFGLLINSIAIVIGAMLIAPLFWPILGMAMGIITQRREMLKRSGLNLFLSITVVVVISFLASFVTPIATLGSEILSRTEPTVLDLLIALTSSVIGVAALRFKKISASTTGVAISLSLLPALAVVGIALSYQQPQVMWGALLLFIANMVAIVFAGCLTLLLLGVRPEYKAEEKRLRFGLLISLLAVIALAVPLSLVLINTTRTDRLILKSEKVFREEVKRLVPTIRQNGVEATVHDQTVHIAATLYAPEDTVFTTEQRESLVQTLHEELNRSIDLQLNIVTTVELHQTADRELAEQEQNVISLVEEYVAAQEAPLKMGEVTFKSAEDSRPPSIHVYLYTSDLDAIPLNMDTKIAQMATELLDTEPEVSIEIIPLESLSKQSKLVSDQLEERIIRVTNEWPRVTILDVSTDFDLETATVIVTAAASSGFNDWNDVREAVETELQTNFEDEYQLELRTIATRQQ